jgi:hypothetical protein
MLGDLATNHLEEEAMEAGGEGGWGGRKKWDMV